MKHTAALLPLCLGVVIAVACTPAAAPLVQSPVTTPQAAPAAAPRLTLVRRFGDLRFRHSESVRRVVALGDGRTLASVAEDAVRVWDATGAQIATIPGNAVDIASPPGTATLLVAQKRRLAAYELEGGSARPTWRTELAADVVPFGLEARGSSIRVVLRDRVVEVERAGGRARESQASSPWLTGAAAASLSPDGTALVVRGADGLKRHLLAAPDGASVKLGGPATGFAVSPDSTLVVALDSSERPMLRAWDLASGTPRWSVDPNGSAPSLPGFAPDGSRIAPVSALGFSPDGSRIAVVTRTEGVVLRDAKTGAVVQKAGPEAASIGASELSLATFTRDGKHLAWGAGIHARLRDLDKGTDAPAGDTGWFLCGDLSPAGDRAIIAGKVWDLDRNQALFDVKEATPDSYFLTAVFGGSSASVIALRLDNFELWDVDRRTVRRFPPPGNVGGWLAFAERSMLFLNTAIGNVTLWRDDADQPFATIDRNGAYGSSDDDHFPAPVATKTRFAVPLGDAVEIFAAGTGTSLGKLAIRGIPRAIAYSREGQRLAVALPSGIEIWNPEAQERLHTIPMTSATAVAFLPEGGVLAYGLANGNVGLYDTVQQAQVTEVPGHHGSVRSLHAAGKRLVSGGAEGTVAIWELGSGQDAAPVAAIDDPEREDRERIAAEQRQREEEAKKLEAQLAEQNAKIQRLVADLERAKEEAQRAAVQMQLEAAAEAKRAAAGKKPAKPKPGPQCNCQPGDPLCTCP